MAGAAVRLKFLMKEGRGWALENQRNYWNCAVSSTC